MYTVMARSIANRYNGTIASRKKCEPFLQAEYTFLFGISFKDPKANFSLLSDNDLKNLSPDTRKKCLKDKDSPFDNLLLIVYKDEIGELSFKLLNGMASLLLEEMLLYCKQNKNTPK